MTDYIFKWKGPGFYTLASNGYIITKIGGQSLHEAKGIAKLIGLNPEKVVYLSDKPEESELYKVHDETDKA